MEVRWLQFPLLKDILLLRSSINYKKSKARISFLRAEFQTKELPVISEGCSMFKIYNTVGATSARIPLFIRASFLSVT